MNRRKWLQALGIAGTAGLAGCQGTSQDPETTTDETSDGDGFSEGTQTETEMGDLPEVSGTYSRAVSSSFDSLNPIYNTESTTSEMIKYAMDYSYYFKPGQVQFPYLLEFTSEDDQVWEAKLRENLEWSDPYGQVTAEDFVYLITEVYQTEWAASPHRSDFQDSDGNPYTVEQTGEYTFTIDLGEVDPSFPKRPTMWGRFVVPKDLIQSYVDAEDQEGLEQDEELNNLSFTGNLGAYDLDTWDRQNRLVFTRSDDYYLREADDVKNAFSNAPYFESLEVQVIQESSSRLSALRTGELDTAGVPPNQAQSFEDRDDVYLNVSPQPYNVPVFYNQRANGWELFRKQGVRQALGCAVDKERYVEGIFRGYAEPEYTWQPTWSPWYDESQVEKYGTGDLYGPEATRQRMEDAISDTEYSYDGETLVDGDGNQVELTLMYQGSQDTEVQTAQFLEQEFSNNAGISLDLQSIGSTKFVRDYWEQEIPDNADELEWSHGAYNAGPRDVATSAEPWDMSLVYGLNTYPMTPTTNEVFFKKDGTYNPYGYYPSFDFAGLFQEAKQETDEEARKEILAEIFGKLSRDQPMGMLALNSDIYGYRQGIEGPVEEFFSGWDFPAWYRSGDE